MCTENRNGREALRTLIYFPIVHSEAEMGSLSSRLKQVKRTQFGSRGLARSNAALKRRWDEIEKVVGDLAVLPGKTRIYQDGLPVCGNEAAIVSELAAAGSRNHQLLLRLQERGAELMGTESAELLVQEYRLVMASMPPAIARAVSTRRVPPGASSQLLLEKRDRYIAERINSTLSEGESGILFLGMLHTIEPAMAADIRVTCPLPSHQARRAT